MVASAGSVKRCLLKYKLDTIARKRSGWLRCSSLLLAAISVVGCRNDKADVTVDLTRRADDSRASTSEELHFAIGTMISPRESLKDFIALADYVGRAIGIKVRILQRRGYAETNALLERGEADFAFICTGPFAARHRSEFTLLGVPEVEGSPTIRSLIVVRTQDPAQTVEDLKGSSFGFVDPLSLTGRLYPEVLVSTLTPEGIPFFGQTVFTHSHSDSIEMVVNSRIRAAAVESIVFDYHRHRDPSSTSQLRILKQSGPFPGPPFVARSKLPAKLRDRLRVALQGMHETPEGRRILEALGFTRFADVNDEAYEPVRILWSQVLGSQSGGRH